MSIPKIMGTETEFRFDVENVSSEEGYCERFIQIIQEEFCFERKSKFINDLLNRNLSLEDNDFLQKLAIKHGISKDKLKKIFKNFKKAYDLMRYLGFTGNFLPNGMRIYLENSYIPEASTPECSNPLDVVIWEKAAEKIFANAAEKLTKECGKKIVICKNNSDGFGNSYACHENYLITPDLFVNLTSQNNYHLNLIQELWITFIVTRQIFAGAGKIGSENNREPALYQISQRSDFFERYLSHSTINKRPLINLRDCPYADPKKFRRFHVIVGDSNMSEISSFLKVGTAAIVLQMLEDNYFFYKKSFGEELLPILYKPIKANLKISRDLTCKIPLRLKDLSFSNPIEIQKRFLAAAYEWYLNIYRKNFDKNITMEQVFLLWSYVLNCLETSPKELDNKLDWRIKFNIFENYLKKHNCSWNDLEKTIKIRDQKGKIRTVPIIERLRALDLAYHVIGSTGVYNQLVKKGHIQRLTTDEEIEFALNHPPEDTRAYMRGEIVKRFLSEIDDINWSYIFFKNREDSLVIRLDNPLFFNKKNFGKQIVQASNLFELYQKVNSYF